MDSKSLLREECSVKLPFYDSSYLRKLHYSDNRYARVEPLFSELSIEFIMFEILFQANKNMVTESIKMVEKARLLSHVGWLLVNWNQEKLVQSVLPRGFGRASPGFSFSTVLQ